MNTTIKLCSEPVRTVMFRPICSICGNKASHYVNCEYQRSTIACDLPEHRAWAERDAKAWLHRNKMVRRKEYSREALFQQTDLLYANIMVKRSSGAIDMGWIIPEPSYDDLVSIIYLEDVWTIRVLKPSEDIQKYAPIEDLKMSISDEFHPLVDALMSKLEAGFYTAESEAYDHALKEQEDMENPLEIDAEEVLTDHTYLAFHPEYGYGRVFQEPVPKMSSANPS